MKKNILIAVLFMTCGLSFYNQHLMSKEIDRLAPSCNIKAIDWPEEMPIATNGDKFIAELKDGVLYVGFDNKLKYKP